MDLCPHGGFRLTSGTCPACLASMQYPCTTPHFPDLRTVCWCSQWNSNLKQISGRRRRPSRMPARRAFAELGPDGAGYGAFAEKVHNLLNTKGLESCQTPRPAHNELLYNIGRTLTYPSPATAKTVMKNCANCGQLTNNDPTFTGAVFCCSACKKRYYSTRPIRKTYRRIVIFFTTLFILLYVIGAMLQQNPDKKTAPTESSTPLSDQP
jgi:hypothetical protein